MSTALGRSARRLPGRGVIAKAACVVAYAALAWLFGGTLGLVVGIAVVLARWAFGFATSWLWIGSIAALTAACVATIVQGLPNSSVVGPDFGEHHIAAHVLVGVSLALAAFAGLLEADRTRWRRPRRHRLVAARAARRGSGVAVATAATPSGASQVGPQPDLRPTDVAETPPEQGRLLPAPNEAPGKKGTDPPPKPAAKSPPRATRPPANRRRASGSGATGRRDRQGPPSPDPPPAPGAEQPPRP